MLALWHHKNMLLLLVVGIQIMTHFKELNDCQSFSIDMENGHPSIRSFGHNLSLVSEATLHQASLRLSLQRVQRPQRPHFTKPPLASASRESRGNTRVSREASEATLHQASLSLCLQRSRGNTRVSTEASEATLHEASLSLCLQRVQRPHQSLHRGRRSDTNTRP